LLFTRRPLFNASCYLAGFVAGVAGLLGVGVALAAAAPIASANLSTGQQIGVSAIYVFVAVLGVAAPILVALLLGDRSDGVLEGWKAWLDRNHASVLSLLFLIFGVVLILRASKRGLGHLAPDCLTAPPSPADGFANVWPNQRFCHLGARFSANARGPSLASSLLKTSPEISDSIP
jgi:Sap, sulfolipid-1-addressing protein